MGRPSRSRSLAIWANGIHVGLWTLPARGGMQLRYDPAWIASPEGRPLSLSLPFNLENRPLSGEAVRNWFDNLLPDAEAIRRRVAERFRTGSTDPFDLLAAVGRDCVGAVQLLRESESPDGFDRVDSRLLAEDDVERVLVDTTAPTGMAAGRDPAGRGPDTALRLSLAGAQEKTALLHWRGRWRQPLGATPTTHILKLPLGLVGGRRADFTTSVDNEWLCMKLLKAYGLPVAEVDIARFGSQRVLVVERFDRRRSADGRWLMRLPQEDFCQVAGIPPHRKYESDGGPGLAPLFTTLRQSVDADADMRTLMASQVLFWLLRAPDGHAKNFSLRILPQGRFRLTPLYDVMSAWPVLGDGPSQWSSREVTLAMALLGKHRHYRMATVQRRHFNETARRAGYGETAEPIILDILAKTPAVIGEVSRDLPAGFSSRVAETVLTGLARAAKALEAMTAA